MLNDLGTLARCLGRRARTLVTTALVVTLYLSVSRQAAAQTSPVDLMDLSLGELLEMITPPTDNREENSESWHFGYQYARGHFGGYRDGTGPVDNVDLLGPPNNTTYPILQTKIVQEVHLFRTAYDVNQRLSATVVLPFIQQLTDHVSLVPGYKDFTITSKGIGDMSLSLSGLVHQGARDSVTINGGISVPTGSITEKGNTPAGPGSQLPYTMQLGSGTWDIPSRSELSARNERCGSFRSCSVSSPGHWKGSNRREFSRLSTGASPGVGRLRVDSAAEMAFPISRPVQ